MLKLKLFEQEFPKLFSVSLPIDSVVVSPRKSIRLRPYQIPAITSIDRNS